MLEFEQLKLRLLSHRQEIDELKDAIGYDRLKREIEELELKSAAPGFWDDQEKSQSVVSRIKSLKALVKPMDEIIKELDELDVLLTC